MAEQTSLFEELSAWYNAFDLADQQLVRGLLIGLWQRGETQPAIKRQLEALLGTEDMPLITLKVGAPDEPFSCVFAPDERSIFTADATGVIRQWDVQTKGQIRELVGETRAACHPTISPDERYLLTGGWDGIARMWEIATGREVQHFDNSPEELGSVQYSSDGRYVLTCGSGSRTLQSVWLWGVATGRKLRAFGADQVNYSAAFTHDDQQVITGNNHTAIVWEVATGREIARFDGHQSVVSYVGCSPDGRYVLTGSYMTAYLWDANTYKKVHQFEFDDANAAFSLDGHRLVLGSRDESIRVFDLDTMQETQNIRWFADAISCVGCSTKYIFAASRDGYVKVWKR